MTMSTQNNIETSHTENHSREVSPRRPEHFQQQSQTLPANPKVRREKKKQKEKRFLREVQDELEGQRDVWNGEVEKMIEGLHIQQAISKDQHRLGSGAPSPSSSTGSESGNYVDTSTGHPVFKAFVDVSDYPAHGVSVTIDKLDNKLIVQAKRDINGANNVARMFTRKVQLPKYTDDARVRTKLSRKGMLTIEVPLLFYFENDKKVSKSFINQVKTNPDGGKSLEILVNVGADVRPWELKVRINDKGELLIHSETEQMLSDGDTAKKRTLIKRYTLPENAQVTQISSRVCDDGRLAVNIPIKYAVDVFNTL